MINQDTSERRPRFPKVSLIGAHDRLVSPSEKKRFADDSFQKGVIEASDWTSALMVVELGYSLHQRQDARATRLGNDMLRQFEQYLEQHPYCLKSAFREESEKTTMFDQAVYTMKNVLVLSDIHEDIPIAETEFPGVNDFIVSMGQALQEIEESGRFDDRFAIIPNPNQTQKEAYQEAVNSYGRYAYKLEAPITEENAYDEPIRVIEDIKKLEAPPLTKFPDLYRKKISGVSLEILEKEENPDTFTLGVLKWMSGIGNGNLLWSDTGMHLFHPDVVQISMARNEQKDEAGMTRKSVSYEWLVAQKLLLPFFSKSYQDRRFDRVFAQALETGPEVFANIIGSAVVKNVIASDRIDAVRDPKFATKSSVYNCPIRDEVHATKDTSHHFGDPAVLSAKMSEFLATNRQELLEDLRKRFGKAKHFTVFENAFTDTQKRYDARVMLTDLFVENLRKQTDGQFADKIRESVDALGQIVDEGKITLGVTETEIDNAVFARLSYPEGAKLKDLGFDHIEYARSFDGKFSSFIIRFSSGLGIAGIYLDKEHAVVPINIDVTSIPEISGFIGKIIESSYGVFMEGFHKRNSGINKPYVRASSNRTEVKYSVGDNTEPKKVTEIESPKAVSLDVDPDDVLLRLKEILDELKKEEEN